MLGIFSTLPKTNIASENRASEKESSLPTIHFQGRAVSFREGNIPIFGNYFDSSNHCTLRIQVCPKKGITPTFLF